MYNAYSRLLITVALGGTMAFSSCGNSDEKKAREYVDLATKLMNDKEYDAALANLDSLDRQYPSEIEVRREGMSLRPQIIELSSLKQIEQCDSAIAGLIIESNRLKESLKFVPDAFEGYYTTKALAGKVPAEKSGLYARMTPDGVYMVIASSTQKSMSTGVTLIAKGGESVSTPDIANDGERNDRSRGVEIITFMPDECVTLGQFAEAHGGIALKIRYNGAKPYEMPLPEEQAYALGEIYRASKVFRQLRLAQLQKSRLEKQLEIARNQRARTFRESAE